MKTVLIVSKSTTCFVVAAVTSHASGQFCTGFDPTVPYPCVGCRLQVTVSPANAGVCVTYTTQEQCNLNTCADNTRTWENVDIYTSTTSNTQPVNVTIRTPGGGVYALGEVRIHGQMTNAPLNLTISDLNDSPPINGETVRYPIRVDRIVRDDNSAVHVILLNSSITTFDSIDVSAIQNTTFAAGTSTTPFVTGNITVRNLGVGMPVSGYLTGIQSIRLRGVGVWSGDITVSNGGINSIDDFEPNAPNNDTATGLNGTNWSFEQRNVAGVGPVSPRWLVQNGSISAIRFGSIGAPGQLRPRIECPNGSIDTIQSRLSPMYADIKAQSVTDTTGGFNFGVNFQSTFTGNIDLGTLGSKVTAVSGTTLNGLSAGSLIRIGTLASGATIALPASGLKGQIILNAQNLPASSGPFWNGAVNLNGTPIPAGEYAQLSTSLGGGAVGVASFALHDEDCQPPNSALPAGGQMISPNVPAQGGQVARLRHYGPVRGTTANPDPLIPGWSPVRILRSQVAGGTETDVTGSFLVAVPDTPDTTTGNILNRDVIISGICNGAYATGLYRVVPKGFADANPRLVGRYVDGSAFVQAYSYYFRLSLCGIADVAGLGGSIGPDGQLTADDIIVFNAAFFASDFAVADIAKLGGGLGPDGQITVDDMIAFLTAFFNGCEPAVSCETGGGGESMMAAGPGAPSSAIASTAARQAAARAMLQAMVSAFPAGSLRDAAQAALDRLTSSSSSSEQ